MAENKNNQLELFSIANPCVGICETNPRGYCVGCLRSREERFNWHLKSEQEQRKIIQLLAQRKARLAQQVKTQVSSSKGAEQANDDTQSSLFNEPDKDS